MHWAAITSGVVAVLGLVGAAFAWYMKHKQDAADRSEEHQRLADELARSMAEKAERDRPHLQTFTPADQLDAQRVQRDLWAQSHQLRLPADSRYINYTAVLVLCLTVVIVAVVVLALAL